MTSKIFNFTQFSKIFEGGAAIKTSRRIREDEFPGTLESIKEVLFPILGMDPNAEGKEYLIIGSIGKKKDPSDTSGDLDIGYDGNWLSRSYGVGFKEVSGKVFEVLSEQLPGELGFEPEINYLKGLNIVSLGWPIKGDPSNGIVQLDLIPISSMDWAKFIYYSPNYKMGESKYKSAHRNWLLSAILSARKEVLDQNEIGEIMDYNSPVLILSDGLYWHTNSYRGKRIPRLKHSKKIEGSERFITRDPQEFVEFALGPGYTPDDVKTFADLLQIITDTKFELYQRLPEIKQRFLEYMERTGLEVPSEMNTID